MDLEEDEDIDLGDASQDGDGASADEGAQGSGKATEYFDLAAGDGDGAEDVVRAASDTISTS